MFCMLNHLFYFDSFKIYLQVVLRKLRIEVRTNLINTLTNTIMRQLHTDYF